MMKTALIAASLAIALFLTLGSTWAEQPPDGPRISDETAKRPAERLAGNEPGQGDGPFVIREPMAREWRISISRPPVTPCLAQSRGADACAAGRDLSRMGPCLDARNCPAFDTWVEIYGLEEPRVVPAQPAPPAVPVLASATKEE